jgi:hypothetical protein
MTLLIVAAMLATVLSLLLGIATMATGHEIAHRSSEQWMFARVGFQAIALVFLVLAMLLK